MTGGAQWQRMVAGEERKAQGNLLKCSTRLQLWIRASLEMPPALSPGGSWAASPRRVLSGRLGRKPWWLKATVLTACPLREEGGVAKC
eukprot:CAMPEP_0202816768 /NCGR_PEP_ID=MMETSP1389-20130828/7167_1 /ASSEMBLY_ACC=CAM_ASM_000865 /TAXON_ID=302021 /ORGANISM="Rhodomonas sp., Strain CCMP768" /LENGTH=87 /DNA_ID=CAMNT_0049488865 /DNA_START=14 /DNA_END=277 /DNA_ORIENTATION=+